MDFQTCLVTGGAGFIGSELTRQLSASGKRVVVVDNLVNGKAENVAGLANVELVESDIRDDAKMTDCMSNVDVVFHLACLGVRHSLHAPRENHDVNATGTLQLLTVAKQAGVKRFVYVSSSEVYGTAIDVPMTELHPTIPKTLYGASKLAGECYTRAYWDSFEFPTVVVRPFNAFGPRCHHEGDSGEVIPKFLLRSLAGKPMIVFGDGTQTRDFTYVEDTARGIALAASSDDAVGETINVGQGKEITVNALADTIAGLLGSSKASVIHDQPRPGDVLRLYANSTKARRLLGFEPTVSLGEGLGKLLAWYRSQGKSPDELLQSEVTHNWQPVARES